MTVKEFLDFTSYGTRVILKDSYNAHEYTNPKLHMDKEVSGCFARIASEGDYARAVIIAWVKHDFGGDRA
jgi:hypothetical protein